MRYLQNLWYCSALGREVTQKPFRRMICDLPLVLYRGVSGRAVALEDRCSHRQAPLSEGEVIGDEIQCRYHGFAFDGTGRCTQIPRQDVIPSSAHISSYPAVERWGYVWVWIGDAPADETAIPDLPWTEATDRRSVFFRWEVAANFQLMADNLLDVSHTDFLHRNSIGSQIARTVEQTAPRVELDCRVEGDRVHFRRTVYDTDLGPISSRWACTTKRVNRTNLLMWEAPNTIHSILIFEGPDTRTSIHLDHIMTPATTTTMHYFMNWSRDFGLDNVEYPTDEDVWREQNDVIGGDDIPMVEAQQRNLAHFGHRHDVAARQDQFVVAVHRKLGEIYRRAGLPVPDEIKRTAGVR